jgi:hypothetical protein
LPVPFTRSVELLAGCSVGSLSGETFDAGLLVWCCFPNIGSRREALFLDLREPPGLHCCAGPLSFRTVMGETAGLENHGAQLGNGVAAAIR